MTFQPIRNADRAKQLISFEGMELGEKAWPTDFDAVIEWHDSAWIVFEVKLWNAPVPYGQRLALERYVRDTHKAGKRAVALVVEHGISDTSREVPLADCNVRELFAGCDDSWREPRRPIKAAEAMREFVSCMGE